MRLSSIAHKKEGTTQQMVHKLKGEHDESKSYKAKLIVKGYQQSKGVNYFELFFPVMKMATTRVVLSIVVIEDLHLEQLDMKAVFLHNNLEEDIIHAAATRV